VATDLRRIGRLTSDDRPPLAWCYWRSDYFTFHANRTWGRAPLM